jgi:heme/copper-type cytochrome/quinol oxidase subunit 2
MTGHPALIGISLGVAYTVASALVGVEWLVRQRAKRVDDDDVGYAVLVGVFWWVTIIGAVVIWWYRYRTGRIARKADR